jgi:DNA-binding response OmpR family regulator
MPARNGFELFGDMRALRPSLPVILMSGDHNRYGGGGVNPGAEGYIRLAKPFAIAQLNAAIGFFDSSSGLIKGPQSFGIQSGVTEEIRSPDTEATEESLSNLATSQFNRTS